jgi:thiamine pyrophosphate-dependent acetolactate synthase large subunit-like protein
VQSVRGQAIDSTPLEAIERPRGNTPQRIEWGSDAVAHALRELGIPYLALTPGASFRGLHDSIVNYLGNREPQMLLCLHEEHAVAIAHGFAKVTGRPLAVALHSNVGLMHGSMAIFDSFCDRVPMLLLGANGPLDALARRPWIDWIHTTADQAAIIRPYVKWDDQPGSARAAADSVIRGHMLSMTGPRAPVYISLDVGLQEERLSPGFVVPDVARLAAPAEPAQPDPGTVEEIAKWLREARNLVILAGRCSRSEAAWAERVELAERTGATVFSHLELPVGFPTGHPRSGGFSPAIQPSPELCEALVQADVVLSLDWLDLGGTLERASPTGAITAKIVSVSPDQHLHNGWIKDHQASVPADVRLISDPDATVHRLLVDCLRRSTTHEPSRVEIGAAIPSLRQIPFAEGRTLGIAHIASALRSATGEHPVAVVRVPSAWRGELWPANHPLDHLNGDGGGGLGSAPAFAVGAALALRGTGRLPIAICGDGDFLMGATALWTAVHYRLPLLVVVMNNRSFFNDEMHQHRIAEVRGRPVENRWIGQRIADPVPDISTLARAQGAEGYGPVCDLDELETAARDAVARARDGGVVVLAVWTGPEPAAPAQGPWLSRPGDE